MGLEDLKKEISKIKGVHIQTEEVGTEFIKTPSYDLNRILSGSLFKGIPNKSFSLFVGPEATGKSSFMALCAAQAQKQGFTPIIIDTEGAWTQDFIKRWGIDSENMLSYFSPRVNSVMATLGKIGDDDLEKMIIVIDSIGGLWRDKVITDIEKDGVVRADQGHLQKEIKTMLKMLLEICVGKNSIAMASGHYYGNPTGYGDADQIGGGKFVKLAPHIIVSLKRSKIYENPAGKSVAARGKIVGSEVKAITLKNRVTPPFQEAKVEINYQEGVNKYSGMMDLAIEAGLVSVGGSWYTVGDQKVQGSIKAEELLKEKPEMFDKIDDWLSTTGYSNINENIKAAEEVMEEIDEVVEEEPKAKVKRKVTKK